MDEEGISNLRKVSDEISKEYGLTVLNDAPPINKYSNKNFLYNFANKSWRVQIKEDIERLIENAEDFEELLELLENEGYLINRGKYISVKTFGMKRFVRLKTIDDGKYSEKNLRQRIRSIRYRTYQDQLLESKHILYKNISEEQKSNKINRNKLSGYMSLQQYKMKTFINKQDALANNLTDENII